MATANPGVVLELAQALLSLPPELRDLLLAPRAATRTAQSEEGEPDTARSATGPVPAFKYNLLRGQYAALADVARAHLEATPRKRAQASLALRRHLLRAPRRTSRAAQDHARYLARQASAKKE